MVLQNKTTTDRNHPGVETVRAPTTEATRDQGIEAGKGTDQGITKNKDKKLSIRTLVRTKGNYEEKLSQEIMRRNYHRKL